MVSPVLSRVVVIEGRGDEWVTIEDDKIVLTD